MATAFNRAADDLLDKEIAKMPFRSPVAPKPPSPSQLDNWATDMMRRLDVALPSGRLLSEDERMQTISSEVSLDHQTMLEMQENGPQVVRDHVLRSLTTQIAQFIMDHSYYELTEYNEPTEQRWRISLRIQLPPHHRFHFAHATKR